MIKDRQLITGRERRESRTAALSEERADTLFVCSDDEVGGFHARCASAHRKGMEGQR